jgi:nitrilase
LSAEAAHHGAWLAVLPETFLPGNPDFIDRTGAETQAFQAFEKRFVERAITIPGSETEIITQACREHQIMVAIGVTERPARAGTLYNTLLCFGSDGTIVGRHRKVMPTYTERLLWGMGDGSTLRTLQTAQGIVGGLICWENFMPLARTALYAQGEQIHLAPTLAHGGERWYSAMCAIANEGRMWVISVGNYMRESHLPRELAAFGLYQPDEIINAGCSLMVNPSGEMIACPACGEETILYAEVDPLEAVRAKRTFDVVGHYGRGDLFHLTLRGVRLPIPIGDSIPLEQMDTQIWHVPQQPEGGR